MESADTVSLGSPKGNVNHTVICSSGSSVLLMTALTGALDTHTDYGVMLRRDGEIEGLREDQRKRERQGEKDN